MTRTADKVKATKVSADKATARGATRATKKAKASRLAGGIGPELRDVDPLSVKVSVMVGALGSQARTAEFLGVARSQPGRWLRGIERPNPRARRLIKDFDYVWDRLTDERSAATAMIWLSSPNSFLDGSTPMNWLKARGPGAVVGAFDAEEAGSYA